MAGNRKHHFLYGNTNHRNGSMKMQKWFCNGCKKHHLGTISRNKMLDGFDYCDKMYCKIKLNQQKEE